MWAMRARRCRNESYRTITNDPSGIASADTSPHTGTGPALAADASSAPERLTSRHANVPPRFHAVPSVHATRRSPALLTATDGCLREPLPGIASGVDTAPVEGSSVAE